MNRAPRPCPELCQCAECKALDREYGREKARQLALPLKETRR